MKTVTKFGSVSAAAGRFIVMVSAVALMSVFSAVAPVRAHAATTPGPHSVSAGGESCALTSAGGVKCWGLNSVGQLGDGTTTDRLTPVGVSGLASGVAAIATGLYHTCALTTAGGVKCWGWNDDGQLGDGTRTNRHTPVGVSGLTSGVAAIATGLSHTCALTTAGGAKCWGKGNGGALGDGTEFRRLTPVDVSGLTSGVVAIAAGVTDTCAVTTAGGAKCWGANSNGQLGDGTTTPRLRPVGVSGLTSGVAAIAVGESHTCAVTTAGGAKCWGSNLYGQLGRVETCCDIYTPTDVRDLASGVADIVAGRYHTCVLTSSGGVKCWGLNDFGQLGNGTSTNPYTPVDVLGLTSGVAGVAAGWAHTCVVTIAGGVKCWGANFYGEVGDGTTHTRSTPVDVSGSFFRAECPTLLAELHTSFTLSDGYAVGSVATFVADQDYVLVGSATLACGIASAWNGSAPTALYTLCPTLVATPHTSFTLSDGYVVGSVATFVADNDYVLVGSATLTCEPGPAWSGSPPTALFNGTPVVLPGLGSVVEGNSGTVDLQVPVSLSVATVNTVTVSWTTGSAASANPLIADPATDYASASGTVTFLPGETAKTVSISVNGDALVEPDEWIVVSFNHPTNARLGGYYGLGFGRITNDERATVLPGGATVVEGNAGTVDLQVPVTLSNPSTQTVTVQWSTVPLPAVPPRADSATDFTPASGAVTFLPGETVKTVSISVKGDVDVEPNEWIVVSFKNPTNAKMGGFYGLGFGVIINDD